MTPTPIAEITLERYLPVKLKLESHTVPGSHKGRFAPLVARQLKEQRVRRALLLSSGNMAEALAYYTQDADLELIVISDALSPREFQTRLRQYRHVHLEVVNRPDANGSHMAARRERRQEILAEDSTLVEVDQYCDRRIPWAYEISLFSELDEQLKGGIGAIFLPTGTGGLLNGALKYVHRNRKPWTIFGVDAVGSKLHWTPPQGQRRSLSGYGNAGPTELIRDIWRPPYHYYLVHVTDSHTVAACHRLLGRDRLFLGPSSGAAVAGIEIILRHRPELIPDHGSLVAIMPDGGGSYRSTLWNAEWLSSQGFENVAGSGL